MKKFICIFLFLFVITTLSANEIIISFQPKDNTVTIDSIHATNLTKGQTVKLNSGESLLIAPATSSDLIKISDSREGYLYPNPSNEYTTLNFNIAKNEKVYISIYDMAGKMMINKIHSLNQGVHQFHLRFPTPGLYHVTVLTKERLLSYKAVYTGSNQQLSEIQYLGSDVIPQFKSQLKSATEKSLDYSEGDVVHYTVYSGDNTTVISDTPTASKTIEVEFYECKDPDNRNYKIVQIGNQWWMAENLAYLPTVSPSSEGSSTDSYYYVYGYEGTVATEAKATDNYETYGVLYNWPAAMISCPSGWHLPSYSEWAQLAQYVSDHKGTSGKNNDDWIDVGKYLKTTSGWNWDSYHNRSGNGTDDFGFSGLPGGFRDTDGYFIPLGYYGEFWCSTENGSNYAWRWMLDTELDQLHESSYYDKNFGMSIRCVKD